MNGPKILYVIPVGGGIPITETVVNAWIAMVILFIAAKWLTHNMQMVPTRRQAAAEMVVSTFYDLVGQTMGKDKLGFTPYIGTLFFFSFCGSLMSMFGFRPPTGDLNTTLCWALITFFMIQYFGLKTKGFKGWICKFIEPMPIILPLNLISEFSTPISMMFRHFGNIAAGIAITSLLYGGLASLSSAIFGGLTSIPILQLGLPALLSVYFDIFTSFLQAFIFAMLTMVFVSGAMD